MASPSAVWAMFLCKLAGLLVRSGCACDITEIVNAVGGALLAAQMEQVVPMSRLISIHYSPVDSNCLSIN